MPFECSSSPERIRIVALIRSAANTCMSVPFTTPSYTSGLPSEDRHLATVRENVLLQLANLRSYDPVREAERAGALTLHGWVYHLETGALERYDLGASQFRPLKPAEFVILD